jgi:hypothetical protein
MVSIERQVLVVFARSNFFSLPLLGLRVSLLDRPVSGATMRCLVLGDDIDFEWSIDGG